MSERILAPGFKPCVRAASDQSPLFCPSIRRVFQDDVTFVTVFAIDFSATLLSAKSKPKEPVVSKQFICVSPGTVAQPNEYFGLHIPAKTNHQSTDST